MTLTPFTLVSGSLWAFILLAALAALLRNHQMAMVKTVFPLAALASLAAVAGGLWTVESGLVETDVLSIGLPDLPFHMRLDALSGFFISVIGLLTLYVSIYSTGYIKSFVKRGSVTRLVIFYCVFILGMLLVVLADDALLFLISWELMAAASYFLVIYEDTEAENRKAAFLYMVVAHVGAIAILLSFGVMAGQAKGFEDFSGFTFDAMRQAGYSSSWAAAAFFLALFGFGAKAGIIPLHVWLPEAHPVAPSNVSALMSGVMLKTALYGILRVSFDLIRVFPWWWGAVVLVLGLASAVGGILFAIMQKDLKRLLAYSSVENVGIIMVCFGLAMMFHSFALPAMAALALVAGLFHTLNHAMFKGLLFMGAGAVLHATHERDMEQMGGLIHKMPWTAALFLVGCVSISALPPFNGFVSEWLAFQAFLISPSIPNQIMRLIMPMAAALFALSGALVALAFIKAYGVTFLGHWRGPANHKIKEAGWSMRIGMLLPALTCLLLGVMPNAFILRTDVITGQLVGAKLGSSTTAWGWLWLTPIAPERASYSGTIVLVGALAVCVIAYLVLHAQKSQIRRGPIWDCGFEKLTSRMQYNATSFAQPTRRIFGYLFSIKETVSLAPQSAHPAFPRLIRYTLRIRDRLWFMIYKPFIDASFWLSRRVGMLQQGRIQTYLIYSFITIIILLLVNSA